jgi:agmatine deiminase
VSAATPRALGFRMPAEWEPHDATWLSWPRRAGISFPGRYDAVPALWRAMVEALSAGEQVHVNVSDEAQEVEVRAPRRQPRRTPRSCAVASHPHRRAVVP